MPKIQRCHLSRSRVFFSWRKYIILRYGLAYFLTLLLEWPLSNYFEMTQDDWITLVHRIHWYWVFEIWIIVWSKTIGIKKQLQESKLTSLSSHGSEHISTVLYSVYRNIEWLASTVTVQLNYGSPKLNISNLCFNWFYFYNLGCSKLKNMSSFLSVMHLFTTIQWTSVVLNAISVFSLIILYVLHPSLSSLIWVLCFFQKI